MIRKYMYHNLTLRINPRHREEGPQNINSHKTPGRQLKQSDPVSLPRQDDCKTRKDIKLYIPKQRPNTEPPQAMGGTLNNQSTTKEAQP